MQHAVRDLIRSERRAFLAARRACDVEASWRALERWHILAQPSAVPHLRVHMTMLAFAVRTADMREVRGQFLRLLLAPLGNLTGRLPTGNTGRSDVSAFAPMPMPADLEAALSRSGDERCPG